ncbi:MAG: hypothetical protein R2729_19735 [Bryobacteraceae bacterium]
MKAGALIIVAALVVALSLGADAPVVPGGGVSDLVAGTLEAAPGSLIRIAGTNLAGGESRAGGYPLPESLDGVSVTVDDGSGPKSAALMAVSPQTIDAQLPYSLSGDLVKVAVKTAAGESAARAVTLAAGAPRLMTRGGAVLAVRADGAVASAEQPAEAGGRVTLYATGLGPVDPPKKAGEAGGAGGERDPLNWTTLPVQVLVGGVEAPIEFTGLMPGSAGVYQINCVLADSLAAGTHDVKLLAGAGASQTGLVLAVAAAAAPREHWVAPTGTPDGDGGKDKPWDLATALRQPASVRPGDIIWMRGGDYGDGRTRFESMLTGEPGKPVTLRQAKGERATIQGGMKVDGAWAWYRDFEIANKYNENRRTEQAPFALDVFAPHSKLINLAVHDTGQGIGLWLPAIDAEVYGTLIYYNGFLGEDRGHGHGIYTQNREGTKLIHDNIIFEQMGVGIHAYGSENAFVEGYDVRGNVVFENGYFAGGPQTMTDNLLFAVGRPVDRVTVEDNFVYNRPEDNAGYSRIGWFFGPGPNGTATVRNNYFIGGQFSMMAAFWNKLTFTGNVTYSEAGFNARVDTKDGQSISNYTWDNNTHYGPARFLAQEKSIGSEEWKAMGADAHSRLIAGGPEGAWSFVRPNRYEPGRANVIVYNWDKAEQVEVDVSAVLKAGQKYELRDAMDYFGAPVAAGAYQGGKLVVPMTARPPARPTGGNFPVLPRHTLPGFGAFILTVTE